MEQLQEDQVFCQKEDKAVPKSTCRRCPEYLPNDYYNLFHKCAIRKRRFESLYKVYKQDIQKGDLR